MHPKVNITPTYCCSCSRALQRHATKQKRTRSHRHPGTEVIVKSIDHHSTSTTTRANVPMKTRKSCYPSADARRLSFQLEPVPVFLPRREQGALGRGAGKQPPTAWARQLQQTHPIGFPIYTTRTQESESFRISRRLETQDKRCLHLVNQIVQAVTAIPGDAASPDCA
jgi:hypothetical protein